MASLLVPQVRRGMVVACGVVACGGQWLLPQPLSSVLAHPGFSPRARIDPAACFVIFVFLGSATRLWASAGGCCGSSGTPTCCLARPLHCDDRTTAIRPPNLTTTWARRPRRASPRRPQTRPRHVSRMTVTGPPIPRGQDLTTMPKVERGRRRPPTRRARTRRLWPHPSPPAPPTRAMGPDSALLPVQRRPQYPPQSPLPPPHRTAAHSCSGAPAAAPRPLAPPLVTAPRFHMDLLAL